MQRILTRRQANAELNNSPEKQIDIIKQYKELLDSGAITQDEFEQKKKEIMNL